MSRRPGAAATDATGQDETRLQRAVRVGHSLRTTEPFEKHLGVTIDAQGDPDAPGERKLSEVLKEAREQWIERELRLLEQLRECEDEVNQMRQNLLANGIDPESGFADEDVPVVEDEFPAWLLEAEENLLESKSEDRPTPSNSQSEMVGDRRIVKVFRAYGVVFYEGPQGQERLVRIEEANGFKRYFEGPQYNEALVIIESPSGWVSYYKGPRGEERLVRKESNNESGLILYYEGSRGQERKVRAEKTSTFEQRYYEGPPKEEYMVRKVLPNNAEVFYKGPQETMVRVEHASGAITYYEGTKGEERMVRRTTVEGWIVIYEGPRFSEREVRHELGKERILLFEGVAGNERKVRLIGPTGDFFYAGERGEERLVRYADNKDNTITYFTGSQGEESMVRKIFPDGDVHYYRGPKGKEWRYD